MNELRLKELIVHGANSSRQVDYGNEVNRSAFHKWFIWDPSITRQVNAVKQEETITFLLPAPVARMAKPIINEILAKELRGEKYRTSLTDISEIVTSIKSFKWTLFVKST